MNTMMTETNSIRTEEPLPANWLILFEGRAYQVMDEPARRIGGRLFEAVADLEEEERGRPCVEWWPTWT